MHIKLSLRRPLYLVSWVGMLHETLSLDRPLMISRFSLGFFLLIAYRVLSDL